MVDTVTDTTCRTADSGVGEIKNIHHLYVKENDNQFINNRLNFIQKTDLHW